MDDQQFAACMARMKNGDKEALHEIYEVYIGYIFYIMMQVVQNQQDAEDITSDFFIKLWKIADTYEEGSGHKCWMGTIARNMAIDFMRKKKKEILTEDFTDDNLEHSSEDDIEEEVISNITLKEALNTLKNEEKQVVHLKIVGELTFQEIANILTIPLGTVTWRYQNAIKKLRRYDYA